MPKSFLQRPLATIHAAMARLGEAFVTGWGLVEKAYRRPYARVALRLGFWFYPLFAVVALGWLAWDWSGPRHLAAAENAAEQAAAAYARKHGWTSTKIPWPNEAPPKGGSVSKKEVHSVSSAVGSLLGGVFGSAAKVADTVTPESEAEQRQTELDLGPLIAGRVLGARPLWNNPKAQTRVNLIGRWLAMHSSSPNLPWTFGVIDSPEYNAFAAPGGYIFVTRGLYQIVANDEELASVLAHEITHVVQRDRYNVIRKQGLLSTGVQLASEQVHTGGGEAGAIARDYVQKNGASILMTKLDRSAEYRADAIGEVYLARAGMNPLAMYAMLQKMAATGTATGKLEELYSTHPSIPDRLNHIDQVGYGKLAPYLNRPVPQ